MTMRPLAAYRLRPVRTTVVRKSSDLDLIALLTDAEPLSIRSMKPALKVLKSGDAAPTETQAPKT